MNENSSKETRPTDSPDAAKSAEGPLLFGAAPSGLCAFEMPQWDESAAEECIAAFAGKRVLVMGDVMLDEYLIGDVARISPEAPVPVVDITHRAYLPGGAANVAANIASLGGVPLLIGIVGEDENAPLLRKQLEAQGVSTDYLVATASRPTITKTRIVSGQQQIARLDRESKSVIDSNLSDQVAESFTRVLAVADACILSDYAKGLLTARICRHCVEAARQSSKAVVIDPKGNDFGKYAGCTVITPNQKEAEIASGATVDGGRDLPEIAGNISRMLGGRSAVLITRGSDGMTLFQSDASPLHVPALAHEVFDVTGAGDTVGGVLTLALAAKASLTEAMMLSNLAAGLVVQKSGTATVTANELRAACSSYAARENSGSRKRTAGRTYLQLSTRAHSER